MQLPTLPFTLLFIANLLGIESSKVCIFSVVGFLNHRSAYDNLVESLTQKGHDVTVFSTLPLDISSEFKEKVKYINPKAVSSHLSSFFEFVSPLKWRLKGDQYVVWDMLPILTLDLCHIILQDAETQTWLAKEQTYDLFIVDSAWNECGIGLSYVLQAKLILFSFHSHLLSWNLDAFGSVPEVSWLPDPQYASSESPNNALTSFMNKVHLNIRSLRWHIYRNSFMFYQVRKFCRKFLKRDEFPSISEIERNASMVLVNSHFSEDYGRSLPPVFVPVGGIHIRPKTPSSNMLKVVNKFLGNSTSVFVFSIGCSTDFVNNLPEETLKALANAFEKLSHIQFVLFWTGNRRSQIFAKIANVFVLESCSSEVYSLLGRKHVKGFVTQGDLLDIQEAIFHGVPTIMIPVAFEQDANSERVHVQGRGIRLEIRDLDEQQFINVVQDLMGNPIYKNNMRKASVAFQDRPQKPLDAAMWWIDYSLRNPDTSLLKPNGIQENWYSRRSLDAWMFIFLCIYTAVVGAFILLLVSNCKNGNSQLKLKLK